jgi:hypothetical protein
MYDQAPHQANQESRLASLMYLVPDRLKTPLAALSSVGAMAGGVAMANMVSNGTAAAQEQTSTGADNTCPVISPEQFGQPHQGCWDVSIATNADVKGCQDIAVGNEDSKQQMIAWRKANWNRRTSKVSVKEGLRRIQIWQGQEFEYACSLLTKNSVKVELVSRPRVKSAAGKSVKRVGHTAQLHGDDSTQFDGVRFKTVPVKTSFKLKNPHKNLQYGVKDVIVSKPLLPNRPYHNALNPKNDIPGPLKTRRSKPHIKWFK